MAVPVDEVEGDGAKGGRGEEGEEVGDGVAGEVQGFEAGKDDGGSGGDEEDTAFERGREGEVTKNWGDVGDDREGVATKSVGGQVESGEGREAEIEPGCIAQLCVRAHDGEGVEREALESLAEVGVRESE